MPAVPEPPGRHPPAPGSHSSQFAIFQVAFRTSVPPDCSGNLFCSRPGGNFGSAFAGLSRPSSLRLATPGPVYGPSAPFPRVRARDVTEVCTLPLIHSGRIRAPWQPTSIARLPRPSESLCCHRGLCGHSGSTALSDAFRRLSGPSLSASRHPERWREPRYSAFDRFRRCNSAASLVCTLPLMHSGRISAPWPPTSCARLPPRWSGCSRLSPARWPDPDAKRSPHGSQTRMSLSAIVESVAVPPPVLVYRQPLSLR